MSLETDRISRRAFGCLLAGVAVDSPGFATAQDSKAVRRIGVLSIGAPDPPATEQRLAGALRDRGWIEGQNLNIARRYDNGHPEALQLLAEELVRTRVELIVTVSTPATLAAMRATATIPIIFASAGDPEGLGLVASLSHPGGNVTGVSNVSSELTAKQLSVLKELLPNSQRVAFLWERGNPYFRFDRDRVQQTCRLAGIEAIFADYDGPPGIDSALESATRQDAQALIVADGVFTWDYRFQIIGTATRLGMPTMATEAAMAREAGALIAYAPSAAERLRVVVDYVDRVLRGAKPAELPVRQPTVFELMINLRTARALGIVIPKGLLLQANEVIE